jgi:hypothetical protein
MKLSKIYRTSSRRTQSHLEKYKFLGEEKPLAGAMQSHQKNSDTSPLLRTLLVRYGLRHTSCEINSK